MPDLCCDDGFARDSVAGMADTKKAQLTAGVNGDGRQLDLGFFAMLLRDELTGDDKATEPMSTGDVYVAAALLRELSAVYSGTDTAALAREISDRLAASVGDTAPYESGQIIA
jgi:hypothetical protein